jgi:hypothetical protein
MNALVMNTHNSPILTMIQQEFVGYHPLLAIARIAHATDDMRLEFDCHRAIAKHVSPELKNIEIKASVEEHRRVRVSLFDVIEDYPQIESYPQSAEA